MFGKAQIETPHSGHEGVHCPDILGVDVEAIGIKATTTERLGFVGLEQGISAHAVVLLESQS